MNKPGRGRRLSLHYLWGALSVVLALGATDVVADPNVGSYIGITAWSFVVAWWAAR